MGRTVTCPPFVVGETSGVSGVSACRVGGGNDGEGRGESFSFNK